MRKVSDEDQIDILLMFQDAIDIVNDIDNEAVMFAEAPPSFMKSAAKKGTVRMDEETDTYFGLGRARSIIEGKKQNIETIKRVRYVAQSCIPSIKRDLDLDSPLAHRLMMWGIPPSLSGAKRVVKWCDRKIAEAENAKNS